MKFLRIILPFWIFSFIASDGTFHQKIIQFSDLSVVKVQAGTVKVGLLIPDKNALAAKQGAEIAIMDANKMGGINGSEFQLVTKSMEGAWGTGSKQAVSLIFDEGVFAILGSHDGQNAHLVEQVSAKTRTIFLSAWASDPTLAQAFVPWFFNCMPNDLKQGAALTDEIYNKRKAKKVGIICDSTYESKSAVQSFIKAAKQDGEPDPLYFIYHNNIQSLPFLFEKMKISGVDAFVLFCEPRISLKILQGIIHDKMTQPVFGSIFLLDENKLTKEELKTFEMMKFINSGKPSGVKNVAFIREFQKEFQRSPGTVATYAFDGMSLLLEAIRIGGLNRDKVQKALEETHFEGATGTIQFDERGNRK